MFLVAKLPFPSDFRIRVEVCTKQHYTQHNVGVTGMLLKDQKMSTQEYITLDTINVSFHHLQLNILFNQFCDNMQENLIK